MPNTTDDDQFDAILTRQTIIAGLIQRSTINFSKLGKDNQTPATIRGRLGNLQTYWTEFQDKHAQLECLADPRRRQKEYFKDMVFDKTLETFELSCDLYNNALDAATAAMTPVPSSVAMAPASNTMVRLPSINIPKFNGNCQDWENFRDLFESLVHSDPNLSQIQKLHYLKTSLIDEAALLLKHTSVTAANYNPSWELVQKRFENNRILVNSYLQSFLDLPAVPSNSGLVALKELRNKTRDIRAALISLGRPVNLWEDLFIFFIVKKMDKTSLAGWEEKFAKSTKMPTYDELDDYLTERIVVQESIQSHAKGSEKKPVVKHFQSNQVTAHACLRCDGRHPLYLCKSFKTDSIQTRKNFAMNHRLCFNCLKSGHFPAQCQSKNVCNSCKSRHHSLLHYSKSPTPSEVPCQEPEECNATPTPSTSSSEVLSNNLLSSTQFVSSVLPTALVRIRAANGRIITARALLDQGSQISCISERAVKLLRANKIPASLTISGIGQGPSQRITYSTAIELSPRDQDSPLISVHAMILPSLTSYVPPNTKWNVCPHQFRNLKLADPFPQNSQAVDILLGVGDCAQVLLGSLLKGGPSEPIAQDTVFGWVISGLAHHDSNFQSSQSLHVNVLSNDDALSDKLSKFWELEEVPQQVLLSEADSQCEKHFIESHKRRSDGRYIVCLPFNQRPPLSIGHTAAIAKNWFVRNELKMTKNSELYTAYQDFLAEYKDLGHMEKVSTAVSSSHQVVYIPHHPVIRAASQTTKLRVVFNASCRSSNGTTLNSFLHPGPKLQKDLFSLILRWRSFKFVYTADIAKMFRQILVSESDRRYQQIWWRDSPDNNLETFQLNTVTYGTVSAPFLANRVLAQLAEDEGARFPLATPLLKEKFYVDDVLFGADDLVLIGQMRHQLQDLLMAGGFRLRKWASNNPELLRHISADDHGHALGKFLSIDDQMTILGVKWNPLKDIFSYHYNCPKLFSFTKRSFLSLVAGVFDPLGWAAPFLIQGKIIMQLMWLLKIDWDEQLNNDIKKRCEQFYDQLNYINQLALPRWIGCSLTAPADISIHGFADASNAAYAAVIYLRVVHPSGQVDVVLLCAKTKVAPLKLQSIPRLELCGAVLLCKLLKFVKESLQLRTLPIFCWTDSQVTLHWLNSPPSNWKVFVANRVSYIITSHPEAQWRHVSGKENPADPASRGISCESLVNHPLWWHGPNWLVLPPHLWPKPMLSSPSDMTEYKSSHNTTVVQTVNWELLTRFSSWMKLIRVTGYVLRFIKISRQLRSRTSEVLLTVREMREATNALVKHVQESYYSKELHCMKRSKPLPPKSSLLPLTPVLDASGILVVGGRLSLSTFPDSQNHPVIIPKCKFAECLIRHFHVINLHGGTQSTLSALRRQYWVISARSLVKKVIFNCVTCTKFKAQLLKQLMGNLPAVRLAQARPFSHVGVDYASPILFRFVTGRGRTTRRCYVALFVCLTIKAVHIEVVSDLSTPAFTSALDRFVARRGLPTKIYSDNGTNFKGADRELSNHFKQLMSDQLLKDAISKDGLEWHFIPPHAPHFGGIWEAGVKSVKSHLKKVLGAWIPTLEELQTLLCKIEAVLNSRPLIPLNDDPDCYDALSPGHFLIGAPLTAVPCPSLLELNPNYLSRWQTIQERFERFWKVWANDYVNTLQSKTKWRNTCSNLKINDVVIIKNPTLPPTKWSLGRVSAVHPGRDNLVRVVTLRTATSTFKCPITELCKLPTDVDV